MVVESKGRAQPELGSWLRIPAASTLCPTLAIGVPDAFLFGDCFGLEIPRPPFKKSGSGLTARKGTLLKGDDP